MLTSVITLQQGEFPTAQCVSPNGQWSGLEEPCLSNRGLKAQRLCHVNTPLAVGVGKGVHCRGREAGGTTAQGAHKTGLLCFFGGEHLLLVAGTRDEDESPVRVTKTPP